MRREEEEQFIASPKILSSTITGYFISVDVPEVPVGEDILATIDFYAINPGALYWASFLIADSPGLGFRELLDKARETGQEGGRKKTYNLGPMPDKDVAISFFIFGHDDAGYDWSWSEYDSWMTGYPVEITHLDSEYVSLSPGAPPVETETLEIDITPVGSGYVTTSPSPIDVENHFENGDTGQFEYGTRVQVTAHPYAGYEFDHWSDEIEGGTSTSNPEWVAGTMTEHRAVKAHFREIVEEIEILEVHIDPQGAGYVTTNPSPAEGANHFEHGDTGEFEHGITVEVTAHPAEGYMFESWSGEMTDTSDNPAPVYPMTEHRRITAHFTEIVSNFSGMIEEVKPTQFAVGDLIKILVDFKAYAHNPIDWPNWTTKLTATIDGMRDEDDQSHIGEEGHRTGQPLTLGTMPSHSLSGTVTLEAKGEWMPGGWQLLDTQYITITVSGEPPPEPCEPGEWKCVGPDMWGCIDGEWVFVQANAPECVPPEKKFPWVAAALIGGGAAVAIAAAAKKPK